MEAMEGMEGMEAMEAMETMEAMEAFCLKQQNQKKGNRCFSKTTQTKKTRR